MKYKIMRMYSLLDEIEVEADSLTEATEMALNAEIEDGNGAEYIPDSMAIDEYTVEQWNEVTMSWEGCEEIN